MSIVIDANMKLFAERMNITSSRMIQNYGLSTVDEIIEEEASKGNMTAFKYALDVQNSPTKLIDIFKLNNVENKFTLLHNMDSATREKVLPMLIQEDLVMGLYFFTKEKLLQMLMKVDIEQLVNVIREAFPLEQVIMMYSEDDLAKFFQHKDLPKEDVIKQLKCLPPEMMIKFIEGITGMPFEKTNPLEILKNIENMPLDKYRKFMSKIDPDIQRQLTYQLTKEKPDYLTLFENMSYLNMLNTLLKPEMVKPMIALEKETLVNMISELPADLMSIVAAQIDTKDFARYLIDGHLDLLEGAWMI